MIGKIITGTLISATVAVGIYSYNIIHHQLEPIQSIQVTAVASQKLPIKISAAEAAKLIPMNMSEDDVIAAIHDMTHQKIVADEMWKQMDWQDYSSPMPLTDATVNRLIDVIEHNNYVASDDFLKILYRYQKHDYSHAVTDHNDMWRLQGGDEGEARALANPKEEQTYIERNFDVKK